MSPLPRAIARFADARTRRRAEVDEQRWRSSDDPALRRSIAERWVLAPDAGHVKEFLLRFADDPLPPPQISRPLVPDLVASGASLIRFGDGEIAALCGKATWQLHSADPRHRRELFSAAFDYGSKGPYRFAVSSLATKSRADLEAMGKWGVWRRLRALEVLARGVRAGEPPVYDAWAFRGIDDHPPEDPSPLWGAAEAVVLVTNARVAAALIERRAFEERSVFHVEVPEWEAYPHIDRAVEEVRGIFSREGLRAREVPVLVGAGHAGKSAVIRLMDEHRALDLGAFLGPKHEAGNKRGFRTQSMPHMRGA